MTLEEIKQLPWKKYISSNHWRKFRDALLNDPDCVCEICGKRRWSFYKKTGERKKKPDALFNVHHKHYKHLGEESREDVMVLCGVEHDFAHTLEMLSKTRKGIYIELYDLFKKKTGWEYTKFIKEESKNV
jgi:hypothetical protein